MKNKTFLNQSQYSNSEYNTFKNIGNSAALQLMNENGVIQCKLGLEFQTVGGNPNIIEIPEKIDQESSGGSTNLILQGEKFLITKDGRDLEYVTAAVDERSEGDVLIRAVQSIVENHNNIICGQHDEVNRNLYQMGLQIAENGQRNAHPQATIGVTLQSIPRLIEIFTQPNLFDTSTDANVFRQRQHRHFFEKGMNTRPEGTSDEINGFLSLIDQYITSNMIRQRNKKPVHFAKSFIPFMSRTSLYNLFMLLNDSDKKILYNILTKDQKYKDQIIICGGIYDGTDQNSSPITVAQLMFAIYPQGDTDVDIPGTDLIATSGYKGVSLLYENSSGQTTDLSQSKMTDFGMSSPTDIGHGRNGAVIELRELKRNVVPERWVELTQHILVIAGEL